MNSSNLREISCYTVNLNLTQLLKKGEITQSEFEKLIAISRLGFKSVIFNMIVALILIRIGMPLLLQVFSSIPGMSFLCADVLLILGLSCSKLRR